MMQTTWSLSSIIAPALAAIVIALPTLPPRDVGGLAAIAVMSNGSPLVIAIDALTFFLCAAVLLFLHVPSPARPDRGGGGTIEHSLWADIRGGALYIWHRPALLWLLSTFAVANLVVCRCPAVQPVSA